MNTCKYKNELIELMKCALDDKSNNIICLKDIQKLYNILGENNKFIFYEKEDDSYSLNFDEILACILPQEVFDVQSTYIKGLIEIFYKEYKKNKKYWSIIAAEEQKIEQIKFNYKKMEKEDYEKIVIKNKKIKRDSFEYNKILDYKDFELNNNFAYEFAKRKYPKLYIQEYLYCQRIARNYFKYIGPIGNINFLNQNKTNDFHKSSVYNYKDIIFELLDTINKGKSFFNVVDRFYRISSIISDGEEFEIESEDFIITNRFMNSSYGNKITKVMYNFRLPRLFSCLKWETNIRINLALPEEQILDYIKHIKRTLVVKYGKDDNYIFDVPLHNNNPNLLKDFHKNIRKNVDIRETVGDILFTYDCLKLNMSKNEIADKLNEYYFDKFGKYLYSINDLVTAYSKIAIVFIEEEKYICLVDL